MGSERLEHPHGVCSVVTFRCFAVKMEIFKASAKYLKRHNASFTGILLLRVVETRWIVSCESECAQRTRFRYRGRDDVRIKPLLTRSFFKETKCG